MSDETRGILLRTAARDWIDGGDGLDRWPWEADDELVPGAKTVGYSTTALVTERKVYMYFEDGQWVQRDRPLPPPPVCLLCKEPSNYLMRIGYESKYDEDWICPACLDTAIDLLRANRGVE